ncbi:MAG: hypothetical protein ABW352_07560, partial [Polyangiales bacterium]
MLLLGCSSSVTPDSEPGDPPPLAARLDAGRSKLVDAALRWDTSLVQDAAPSRNSAHASQTLSASAPTRL